MEFTKFTKFTKFKKFKLLAFVFMFSSLGFSQTFENERDEQEYKKYANIKPDVVSQSANLEDYYTWNGYTWIWKEKFVYPKGIVILGKLTIKYL